MVSIVLPCRGIGPSFAGFVLYLTSMDYHVELYGAGFDSLPLEMRKRFLHYQKGGRLRVFQPASSLRRVNQHTSPVLELIYALLVWLKYNLGKAKSPIYVCAAVPPAFLLLLGGRAKVIFEDGGPLPEYLSPKWLSIASTIMRRHVMKRSRGVVLAGSDFFARRMMSRFHLDSSKVFVQPECVLSDLDRLQRDRVNNSVRFHGRTILCVGGVTPRKNQFVLVKAAPIVLKRFNDIQLIFVGRVEDRGYYNKIVEFINWEGLTCVQFAGSVSYGSLLSLYDRCDLIVHMGISEGMSRTLLEAMTLGKPIVCSAIPENIECMKNGNELRLVAPFDHVSLAIALNDLLGNPIQARRLGENARITALKWFNCRDSYKAKHEYITKALF